MTYLELAEKVLLSQQKPLSYIEIWKIAEEIGLAAQKEQQGKTPWATISAILSSELKNNPNTIFTKEGEKPVLFGLKDWGERTQKEEEIAVEGEEETYEGEDESYNTDIYDPTRQDIDPIQEKWSVYDHIRKIKQGRIVLEVEFQRHLVWKDDAKSRFIESVLMGFPLPPFYLNAQPEGKYLIIDGLQRTTTLLDFLDDRFPLKGLTSLKSLNGKKFTELPMALQARIEDKGLNIYILKATTPLRVIYELFDRINTGGTPLSRQEVRHGIYQGKATILLKELAETYYFRMAIRGGVSSIRMKDREMVLRYLAFKINGYETYKEDLSPFLERTMEAINEYTDTQIAGLKEDFVRVMDFACFLFEEYNFRIPVRDNENNIKGKGAINVSVLESVCYAISECSDEFLLENRNKIMKNYFVLTQDTDYLDAVKNSTGNTAKVKRRFQIAKEILTKI